MTVDITSVQEKKSSKEHLAWANLCRVAAIYGVILLHSSALFFYQYGTIPLGDWLSANFLDSMVRGSVPLFVMLSGALLLKPGAQLVTIPILIRRVAKVLFPLLAWSALYLLYISKGNSPVDWLSILKQPAMYHLWFVYMIIGLYLLLPVYQILFEAIFNRRNFQVYILVVWLIVTCLPVYWPLPLLSVMQQSSFLGYGGYFLMGAVIASSPRDPVPASIWFLILAASVLATFGLTWRFCEQAGSPIEQAYRYFSPNVLVSAVAAFVLFTRAQVPVHVAKVLQWMGDRSFLIYFVHVVALDYVRYSNFISMISQHAPTFVTILAISTITFVVSLMIAAVIRLMPGAQRVFG